jgi:hypothetical protein
MALNFIEDLSISGNVGLPDDSQLQLGSLADGDMKLYHVSGIGSYVLNKTDHLRIMNQANDKDIIFETDDGSGSTTPYITLDGSTTLTQFDKDTKHSDTIKATFGAGADLQIYHDGTESNYVTVTAGDLYLRNESDSQQTYIQATNSSGTTENYIKLDGAQEYTQFDKPARMMDNVYLQFGNSNDSDIYHNGTDMFIRNYSDDGRIRFYCDDGSGGVEEYFYLDGAGGGSQPFTVWPDDAVIAMGTNHDTYIQHTGAHMKIDNYTGNLEISNQADDGDLSLRCDNGSGGSMTYLKLDGGIASMIGYTDLLFGDSLYLKFGASQDLTIVHNATNSYIQNYTGDLQIENHADDGDILLRSDDGSGGLATYMYLDGGNTRVQFNKDARFVDGTKILIGTGDDGQIYSSSDDLYIDQTTADKDIIFRADDGSGSTATYFYLDGSGTRTIFEKLTRHVDDVYAAFGSDSDLRIYHDGSDSYIKQTTGGTGDLYIEQDVADKDIIFKCDDGSGGVEEYFRLDGSMNTDGTPKTVFPDNSKLQFGSGAADLRLWHDATNSLIRNTTGHLYIENQADNSDIIFKCDDGSGGNATYFFLDGGTSETDDLITNFPDNSRLTFGDGRDLKIYHDASNSYIDDAGTGNLLFQSGGSTRFSIGGDVAVIGSTDFAIPQGRKLLLDGVGGHTYIEEESDGNLKFYVSGNQELLITDSLAQFENSVYIPAGIYHTGDADTFFGFVGGDDTFGITTGGGSRMDANNAGVRFGGGGTRITTILDEDNMATDSATALATQQSIKAYVDNTVTGVLTYQGTWNANTNTPTLSSGSGTPGYYYIVSVAGSTDLDGITDWAAGDWAVFSDLATDAWQKIDNTAVGDVSVGSGAVSSRVSYWSGTTTIAGTAGFTFDGSNLAVPGNITLGGDINKTSGNLTLDVAGEITLDTDGAIIRLKDGGTEFGKISQNSNNLRIYSSISDGDILLQGNDDGSSITALQLDMSDAGFATFNSGITAGAGVYIPDYIYHTGDTNTYFGFYTSDTIVFNVAGSEAVRIDANGDVGIGTADPLKKLHIVGPDGVSGSTSGNSDTALLIDNDGSNGAIIELMASNDSKGSIFFTDEDAANRGAITYGHTNDDLAILTAATTALTINSSQAATFTGDVQAPGIYVGATNTSYDFYNNGTSYLNGNAIINANLTVDAGSISISGDGSNAATLTESSAGLLTIAAVDDLVLDAGSDIILDAEGGDIRLKDTGVSKHTISMQSGGDTYFVNETSNADVLFRGVDDGSTITALTLDFSDAGKATFTGDINISNGTPVLTLTDTSSSATVTHTLDGVDYQIANNGTSGNFKLSRKVSTTERVFLHAHDNGNLILYGNGSTAQTISGANTTFAGDISLGDAKKIKLGGAHDFEIYHNNSTNVNHITSLLSRQLKIQADTLYITNDDDSTTYLSFADGGDATFAGQVNVAETLKIGGATSGTKTLIFESTTNAQDYNIDFYSNTSAVQGRINYAEGAGSINLLPDSSATAALSLAYDGTATFEGNVGIGLTTSYPLQVSGIIASKEATGTLRLEGTAATASIFDLKADSDVFKIRDVNAGNEMYHIRKGASGYHKFYINDSLAFDIDSSSNSTFAGLIYGPDGTKSLPTYSFTNDTNTGMYSGGTDILAFSAGGNSSLLVKSDEITAKANIVLDGKNIQLDTAVSASTSSGTIIKIGSTVSMSAGQVVYGSNSMGSLIWAGTDADTGTKNILGLALGTSPTSDGILLNGIYHEASHGFTVGLPLYISTTGGEMTTTAPSGSGDYVRVVGYAIDANHIYFCPDNTWVEIS